jgi:hypothetical protein
VVHALLVTSGCTKDKELHARVESLERENAQLTSKIESLEASRKDNEGLLAEQKQKIDALEKSTIELVSEVEVYRGFFNKGLKVTIGDVFSSALDKMDAKALTALGLPFEEKAQALFSGNLRVKRFARGFICANNEGATEVIVLKDKSPHLPPFGRIEKVFRKQGGSRTFGNPIEGEHSIFNDAYRLHVFEKAIIFWTSNNGTQSAIYSSKFK